jgi:uncharacterized protein (DUF983 family)
MNKVPAPDTATAAIRGLCPRCGARGLFAGAVSFAPKCTVCDLDYEAFNVGDGPAAFLILIIGGLVTFLAIMVELNAGPPWWVHVLLWLPLTLILIVGSLRLSKALLLILEYRNQAREGRLDQ